MKYQIKTPEQLALLDKVATQLKVLSHPKRLLIVDYLSKMKQAMSVTDIYQALELPQAIASQHLIQMKDRGILKSTKIGTKIFYQVAASVSVKVLHALEMEGA